VNCAKCKRKMALYWHVRDSGWKLLARKWWEKTLCIECFFELVSQRQNRLVIFEGDDFGPIIIATKRARGKLNGKWLFQTGVRVSRLV
jgi:hypothetical protein